MIAHASKNHEGSGANVPVDLAPPAPATRQDRHGNELHPGDRVVLTGTVTDYSRRPGKRYFQLDIDCGPGQPTAAFVVTGAMVELLGAAPVAMPDDEADSADAEPAAQVVS